ncbi:glycosyltransferase family 39 protein [Trichocoleus sp. DQ-U1]|uniref:glycosyltransferase family 39 protein n=1 Tax=Trichocoleus sp. DQ-U1 TaxID=2933926 RepID=UPI003296EFCB
MENKTTPDLHVLPLFLKALLILSLVLGIFLRFYHLDQKIYSNDETFSTTYIFGQRFLAVDDSVVGVDELQKYQWINPDISFNQSIQRLVVEPYVFPPVFSVGMRIWSELGTHIFSNPLIIQRSFSAFISLFVLVGIYWLCWELFEFHLAAWIATALVAVSPFHLQYAQVVRPYSLLAVVTLLSSAALLRAMRTKTKLSWVIYGITAIGGLYSNVLFGFVLIAHGAYVFLTERFRFNRNLICYLLASACSGLIFLPWFYLFMASGMSSYSVDQVSSRIPLLSLIKVWIDNIVTTFVDFYDPWAGLTQNLRYLQLFFTPLILIITGFSFYLLFKKNLERVWLFILTLIGMTGVLLMLKDIITGGSITTRFRYLIPTVLGLEIVVSYFLANWLTSKQSWQRTFGKVAASAVLLSGIISCVIIAQTPSWSAFGSPHYPAVARTINQATRPLVITDNLGRAFTLSYLLDSKVQFKILTKKASSVNVPDGYSDVFLLEVSKGLLQKLKQEQNYKIEPVLVAQNNSPKIQDIWRLEKN